MPATAPVSVVEGGGQFLDAHARGPELSDHDARGGIGQRRGVLQVLSGRERRGQHRDHGVAGAGDVVHLARLGRELGLLTLARDQQHAAPAARDQERREPERLAQAPAFVDKLVPTGAFAHDGLELLGVRRQHGGTPIARKIAALGVHDDGLILAPREIDDALHIRQTTLGIVRQDHDLCPRQRRSEVFEQLFHPAPIVYGLGAFEIEADELLVLGKDAQLDGGGRSGEAGEPAPHPEGLEPVREHRGGLVGAGHADEHNVGTERRDVGRDVGGPARPFLAHCHVYDRHRRLGRNAAGRARPVAIEDHVPDDENRCGLKGAGSEGHHWGGHRWGDGTIGAL